MMKHSGNEEIKLGVSKAFWILAVVDLIIAWIGGADLAVMGISQDVLYANALILAALSIAPAMWGRR